MMRLLSSLVLFVLLTLLAEDTISAHATAQDCTAIEFSQLFDPQHDSSFPQNCDSCHHRDSAHFGHCSFLLISPLLGHTVSFDSHIHFSQYSFSLKINDASTFLRPPIQS